ncbi:MAG: T9SS type A sorting domain-containing protein, partial [Pedobacter sp.]
VHPGTPAYEVNGYDRSNSNVIRFAGDSWIPNMPSDAENEGLFGTGTNYWTQQISYNIPDMIGANSFYGKSNAMVVLPVRLVNFNAVATGCKVLVDFSTSLEQNTKFFYIERSYTAAAGSWSTIAKLNATGNSNTLNRYNVADDKASSGLSYYRLAIADVDGTVTYGPIRQANVDCGKTPITIYPNPVQNFANVKLPVATGKYQVRVMNVNGQTVLPVLQGATGIVNINTAKLASGNYIIQVTDENGKVSAANIIKQ